MQNYYIQAALFLLDRILGSGIVSDITDLALRLMTLERNIGETDRQYNDRRKYIVIDTIKLAWPKARTALLDAALGLVVAKLNPK